MIIDQTTKTTYQYKVPITEIRKLFNIPVDHEFKGQWGNDVIFEKET